VIKEGAVLRVQPDPNSMIIRKLPVGSTFTYEYLENGWYKVVLPPDIQGIVISGYVHFLFMEKQTIQLESESKPEISLDKEESYFNWKRELTKAQSLGNSGIPLLVIGTAILSPSLYFVIRGPGEGGYYYTWAKILMGAGILGGTACVIFGISNMTRGSSLVRQLEDEGYRRGYIRVGLLPNYGAIGFQVGIKF